MWPEDRVCQKKSLEDCHHVFKSLKGGMFGKVCRRAPADHIAKTPLNIPSHDHHTSDSLGPDELDALNSCCEATQAHQVPCVF